MGATLAFQGAPEHLFRQCLMGFVHDVQKRLAGHFTFGVSEEGRRIPVDVQKSALPVDNGEKNRAIVVQRFQQLRLIGPAPRTLAAYATPGETAQGDKHDSDDNGGCRNRPRQHIRPNVHEATSSLIACLDRSSEADFSLPIRISIITSPRFSQVLPYPVSNLFHITMIQG